MNEEDDNWHNKLGLSIILGLVLLLLQFYDARMNLRGLQ